MKLILQKLAYTLLANIPVSFLLCLTSSLLSGSIDWAIFGLNLAIAISVATIVGMFVPLSKIGAWFTSLFGVSTLTYTKNIRYRLLSTAIITVIYFLALTPLLCFVNVILIHEQTFIDFLKCLGLSVFPLLLTGFLSSIISDYFAYHIAYRDVIREEKIRDNRI